MYNDYRLVRNSLLLYGDYRPSGITLYRENRSSLTAYFVQELPPGLEQLILYRHYHPSGTADCTATTVRQEPLILYRATATIDSSGAAYFVLGLPSRQEQLTLYRDYRLVRNSLLCRGTTVSSGTAYFVQGLWSRQEQLTLYRDYRLVRNSLLCTGTTVSSGTDYFVQTTYFFPVMSFVLLL